MNVRRRRNNCKGFTLVEIVVCFALIGVLMSAVAVVLPMFQEVTMKTSAMARSENLADTLMQTIEGELMGAAAGAVEPEKNIKVEAIPGDGENNTIAFKRKDGKTVKIFNGIPENGGGQGITWNMLLMEYNGNTSTPWYYGPEVYMRNRITSLVFTYPVKVNQNPQNKERENLVGITLTLKDDATGYTSKRSSVVKCYYLPDNPDQ